MKPRQENILYPHQSNIKIVRYKVPYFDMNYHFHEEYELVYIVQGTGKRYIGNSIHKFKEGDMVFLGPNLAHMWISKKRQNTNDKPETEAIVMQFSPEIFKSMIETTEFIPVKEFFTKAAKGLKITGNAHSEILNILYKGLNINGIEKLMHLIKIIDILSKDKNAVSLNPYEYPPQSYYNDKRIDEVQRMVISNCIQNIAVKDAASVANMEQSAFCRFFKDKTQKTFVQFLNETRINLACKHLSENQLTINQVAYESGFNNMANFYRQFKKVMGKSPGEYRKEVSY